MIQNFVLWVAFCLIIISSGCGQSHIDRSQNTSTTPGNSVFSAASEPAAKQPGPKPRHNQWLAISTTGAPSARHQHAAMWTGAEMIVWGGDAGLCCWSGATQFLGTGGIYDPTSDTWEPVATRRAPAARAFHSAVWTGSQMLVWGGATSCIPDPNAPLPAGVCSFTNTGGLIDPKNGKWRETTTRSAPDGRFYASTVWTGDEMLIWGGSHVTSSFFQSGARYRP